MSFFKSIGTFVTKNIKSGIKDISNLATNVSNAIGGVKSGQNNTISSFDPRYQQQSLPSLEQFKNIFTPTTTTPQTGNNTPVQQQQQTFNFNSFLQKNALYIFGSIALLFGGYYVIKNKR